MASMRIGNWYISWKLYLFSKTKLQVKHIYKNMQTSQKGIPPNILKMVFLTSVLDNNATLWGQNLGGQSYIHLQATKLKFTCGCTF